MCSLEPQALLLTPVPPFLHKCCLRRGGSGQRQDMQMEHGQVSLEKGCRAAWKSTKGRSNPLATLVRMSNCTVQRSGTSLTLSWDKMGWTADGQK